MGTTSIERELRSCTFEGGGCERSPDAHAVHQVLHAIASSENSSPNRTCGIQPVERTEALHLVYSYIFRDRYRGICEVPGLPLPLMGRL